MNAADSQKKNETNVKDTIESILVAFILAFIFRCFIVEAFVIPTGSMAPTLLGAHMDFRCPDCGYRFTAGYHVANETFTIGDAAKGEFSVYCPNCGYKLPRELASDPDNDATNPLLKYGDRILVMKYTYLFNEPSRWDVVVFKSPSTDRGDYSVNYIKRLVGKPGESLFVAHGDLYVAPPGANADDPKSYQVQPKPRWVQDALWRIVFDADYLPASPERRAADQPWQQPWRQARGSGWINNDPAKNVSARQFVFDNSTGGGQLEFRPDANPTAASFNDWLAYDQTGGQDRTAVSRLRDVGDLKLSFFISDLAGEGVFRAVLGKETADRTANIEFFSELSASQARLLMKTPLGEKVIGVRPISLAGTHEVSIENVDYRVSLRIDNEEIFATTPADYAPDVRTVLQYDRDPPRGSARLEAERVKGTITHLQLWRDVYYRDDDPSGRLLRGFAHGDLKTVVKLAKQEYFVLGDNSSMSLDARYWYNPIDLAETENLNVPAGVVPERFMLGKAFFVYWPAGYRPIGGAPSLVPNFGQMRFIR